MEALFALGETTAPGTVVVQLYVAAPLTGGTLNVAELLGQTKAGPLMVPGNEGVLLIVNVRTVLLYPQFREAYTLNVPLVQPARKFTVTLLDGVVTVFVPPLMVALPVMVHV